MSNVDANQALEPHPPVVSVVIQPAMSPGADQIGSNPQPIHDKEPSPEVWPRFFPQHRRLVRLGTGLLLGVLCVEWFMIARRRPEPLTVERGNTFQTRFVIDVNTANWVEWSQLEGIGPGLAHRIIAYRKVHGPFRSIEDLLHVPGIGEAKLDVIRPRLTIRHEQSEFKYVEEQFRSPSDVSVEAQQPAAVR